MRASLTSIFDAKSAPKSDGDESDPWDKINEQYERYSVFMNQIFEFNSGFVQIVNLYIQTFGVFKLKTNLLPTICHASNDILREISLYNTLMKKHQEKVTSFGGDKDRLKKFLDQFSRSLSWFVGSTAYKLIKVKEEKDEKKEGDKAGKESNDAQEKMHDLIIQSNLLSGGMENRFVNLFSAESQSQIEDLIKISEDTELHGLLKSSEKITDDDKVLHAVIHSGENEMVDRLMGYLQFMLERKIPQARVNGAAGMRLSRAAFGVMIKFSDFTDTI